MDTSNYNKVLILTPNQVEIKWSNFQSNPIKTVGMELRFITETWHQSSVYPGTLACEKYTPQTIG